MHMIESETTQSHRVPRFPTASVLPTGVCAPVDVTLDEALSGVVAEAMSVQLALHRQVV